MSRFSVEEAGQPAPVNYEAEGYDGPQPGNVTPLRPLFSAPIEEVAAPRPRVNKQYVATINAALDVVAARLPALIATIAACLLWGFAVYQPDATRTYAALGFSGTALIPTILLYLKRG
ncbi:MAG TPA: hypothetical protein VFB45_15380 [Pseudolabrys sp.]|nr:hypothetical protein [Pseudolabrys sp.]